MSLRNRSVLIHLCVVWIVCIILTVIFVLSYCPSMYQGIRNIDQGKLFRSNSKTRVFFLFGTRPEIIKMAPVVIEFEKSKHFQVFKVFTGQHPDIILPFLSLFDIKIDIHISNTMTKGQSLSMLTAKMISAIDQRINSRTSDIWMVQGDICSAFASAFIAFNRKLRIGHIEAGLRTFNMHSPFPEEFNRKTLASIATFHFAPTKESEKHLLAEGVPNDRIFVTGNTVIDAVKLFSMKKVKSIPYILASKITVEHIIVLVTIHRRENIIKMSEIYNAIHVVSCLKCRFIIPVHPNPNALEAAQKICRIDSERFICVPSLSYQDLHMVINRSQFILTDSGGLQEEATWYHKPTLVLRDHTDRMESVEAGVSVLIGHDYVKLKSFMLQLIDKTSSTYKHMSKTVFPFGYGNSSNKILDVIISNENKLMNSLFIHPTSSKSKNVEISEKYVRKNNLTIGVVLQVFKRNSLKLQLECAISQTLKPKTIIVFQNGFHIDVSQTIKVFRTKHPDIEVQHIASSKNLRYHGRFHIAYMMREDYVSVWDDDVLPKRDWLRYCIEYSQDHDNALVGRTSRSFKFLERSIMHLTWNLIGRNDFVGHTWTLLRDLLKYYVSMKPFTLHTGEDLQLSFALQKAGIETHRPPQYGERSVIGVRHFVRDKNASWRKNQSPRLLLFCKLLQAGFKTVYCSNCQDKNVINMCIQRYKNQAASVEENAKTEDNIDNNRVVWHATNTKISR